MRNEYRRLKFGVVPAEWRQPQVDSAEQVLLSYLRTARDFSLQSDINASIEIFTLARHYIGKSFKDWLVANFNNGTGTRASLVRRIVAWVNGDVSYHALTGEVRRDLNRIDFLRGPDSQLKIPFVFDNAPVNKQGGPSISFDKVKDRHFFEIIAVLGPELTAHFLLSLNGIRQGR